MSVFSVKIRKDLKEKMDKYRDKINWAEEVRKIIEMRIKELEAEDNFNEILDELKKAKWSVPKSFATESVREDRDTG
ncbi:MAG: CopG family transcriptional regulator [Desulfurococcales archaeon]|nr:CopG family transcriptional regulator [Desulfurococcales archaeon]